MTIKASRSDVWMAVIDDRAGGAAEKLEALAREHHFQIRARASFSPGRSKA